MFEVRLVVEANSSIRLRGNRIAHPVTVARTHFEGPLSRNPHSSQTPGLQALVDFVLRETLIRIRMKKCLLLQFIKILVY